MSGIYLYIYIKIDFSKDGNNILFSNQTFLIGFLHNYDRVKIFCNDNSSTYSLKTALKLYGHKNN